jgi:hypothetical protein
MSILASLGLQRSNKLVGNLIKHVGICLFFEDFFIFCTLIAGT